MFDSSWYEICWWHKEFASFDKPNKKAFMPYISRHKYLELNLKIFLLISEISPILL